MFKVKPTFICVFIRACPHHVRAMIKKPIFNISLITLFPEIFSYLSSSIIGKAQKNGIIKLSFYNPRDYSKDKYKHIDRPSYGGGPGMVLQAEPLLSAVDAALKKSREKTKIVITSARGKQFDAKYAKKIAAQQKNLLIICGRYEGIDERVKKILRAEEISIGPYVLTGGELPAMVIVDSIARFLPNVLGKEESLEEKRVASAQVYTRPEIFRYKGKNYRVPKILLSGNHKEIEEWRKQTNSKPLNT